MSSIASFASTSSEVYHPAFRIYRDHRDKSEDDERDGNMFPIEPIYGEIDNEPAPPYIVLVQGPPNVGKSLLIRSVIKQFTKEEPSNIRGPITIITGNKRRLQFIECPNDINGMIDAAKYADLVLLLVDASYGFEAETFEFLNLLRTHGIPPIMGVLTHLGVFKDETILNETKERLQDHFLTEICQRAKISYLSGLDHDLYKMCEVQQLAKDISMLQFTSLSWRAAHPYVLVDRFEDLTPAEELHRDANCKRNLSLYGYLRGCNIKSGAKVHIAGVGDFRLSSVTSSPDPFPLSSEMGEEKDLDELTNMDMESFRVGTYLRLEVCDVPFAMVENFNPCHPILVGGISLEEENVGCMQARLKRHNWHMKPLKSSNPVTVSAGWRRYQTKPIYVRESDNMRHLLKFTPELNHCLAVFWGPLAPPLTRVAVVQSSKESFRIAAKAIVLDPEPDMRIMKGSKQKGIPLKIFNRRTALISFPPDTEVSKFKGAPIRTSNGIRGKVDKVTGKGMAQCTFKSRINRSDTVFMRVLRPVEAPRGFDPLLAALGDDPSQRRGVEIIDGVPCPNFGTTISLVFNEVGVYVGMESNAFEVLSKAKEREVENSGIPREAEFKNEEKAQPIGENIYAAADGYSGWYDHVYDVLRGKENKRVYLENVFDRSSPALTTRSCLDSTLSIFQKPNEELPQPNPKGSNPEIIDYEKESCGITFVSYNSENPQTVHYAARDEAGNIFRNELHRYSNENKTLEGDKTVLCHGSGSDYARFILKDKRRMRRIRKGTDRKIHTSQILKAMLWACEKDPHSGGRIKVILLNGTGRIDLWDRSVEETRAHFPNWFGQEKARELKRLKRYARRWMGRKVSGPRNPN